MGKIKILSTEISNKIAAGEVVQRPLSVVKELVENAIDAGATQISIDLKDSGLAEIRVIDNGQGMSKEDVELCLVRHATSKVLTEADIFKIMTLGFRGEALASISAVSKFELTSSITGESGYKLIKNGDEKQIIEKTAANKGTDIKVKNLFFNTPARYKHLSSPYYELSLIISFVNRIALSHPHIKFILNNDDSKKFMSLGDGNITNVLHQIYDLKVAKKVINQKNQNDHFKIEVYAVKPDITRNRKNHMYISVNGRIIKNYKIEEAIIKGYGHYLHTGQYPIVFLQIEVDYSLVDINIHPTKEQIKISMFDSLENLIISTIKNMVSNEEYIFEPNISEIKKEEEQNEQLTNKLTNSEEKSLDKLFEVEEDKNYKKYIEQEPLILKENNDIEVEEELIFVNKDEQINVDEENKNLNIIDEEKNQEEEKLISPNNFNDDIYEQELIKIEDELISNAKFVGIYNQTYLLFENYEGLFLIDQHAAQERIRYEMFSKQFKEHQYNLQQILVPVILEFTQDEFILIQSKLELLKDLGLLFEEFGNNSIRLIEADQWYLQMKELENDIRKIIQILVHGKKIKFEEYLDEIAIMMACKSSIKAKDYITNTQAQILLNDLSTCLEPYTCPHGRPIIVKFTLREIEKMFKRVV